MNVGRKEKMIEIVFEVAALLVSSCGRERWVFRFISFDFVFFLVGCDGAIEVSKL
jgi:hypothetical protein